MPAEQTNVVFVVFRGGVEGDGAPIPEANAGTAGKLVGEVRARALLLRMKLDSLIVAPGVTSGAAVATARAFIRSRATSQSKLIVYGYSRGGDAAVDLAKTMQHKSPAIDLMITVDAAYGPFSTTPIVIGPPYPATSPPIRIDVVDRRIPANVNVNLNYYQTEPSGPSSSTRTGEASGAGSSEQGGSSRSNSGPSDSIGSRGAPNSAIVAGSTRVYNLEVNNTSHAEIDEKTQRAVVVQIGTFLRSNTSGQRWTPLPMATTGL